MTLALERRPASLSEHAKTLSVERDRRVIPDEMTRIKRVMNRENFGKRQRPVQMEWQAATELMWELGMETAMRMREMYTLTIDQIDLPQRTIFLTRQKTATPAKCHCPRTP